MIRLTEATTGEPIIYNPDRILYVIAGYDEAGRTVEGKTFVFEAQFSKIEVRETVEEITDLIVNGAATKAWPDKAQSSITFGHGRGREGNAPLASHAESQ